MPIGYYAIERLILPFRCRPSDYTHIFITPIYHIITLMPAPFSSPADISPDFHADAHYSAGAHPPTILYHYHFHIYRHLFA